MTLPKTSCNATYQVNSIGVAPSLAMEINEAIKKPDSTKAEEHQKLSPISAILEKLTHEKSAWELDQIARKKKNELHLREMSRGKQMAEQWCMYAGVTLDKKAESDPRLKDTKLRQYLIARASKYQQLYDDGDLDCARELDKLMFSAERRKDDSWEYHLRSSIFSATEEEKAMFARYLGVLALPVPSELRVQE